LYKYKKGKTITTTTTTTILKMVHRLVSYFQSKRRLANGNNHIAKQRDHRQREVRNNVGTQVRVDVDVEGRNNVATGNAVARSNDIIRPGPGPGPGTDQQQLFNFSSASASTSSSSFSSSSSTRRRLLLHGGTWTDNSLSAAATATANAVAIRSRSCSYEADSDSSVSINQDLRDRREDSSHNYILNHNRNTNTVLTPPKEEDYYFPACVSNNHLLKIDPLSFESSLFTHEANTTPIINDPTTHVRAAYKMEEQGRSYARTFHHHGNEIQNLSNFLDPIHGAAIGSATVAAAVIALASSSIAHTSAAADELILRNILQGENRSSSIAHASAAADELILRSILQGENRPVLTMHGEYQARSNDNNNVSNNSSSTSTSTSTSTNYDRLSIPTDIMYHSYLKKMKTTHNTVPSYLSNHAEAAAIELMTTTQQDFHHQLPPPREEGQDTSILSSNRRSLFGSSYGSGLMPHHPSFMGRQKLSEFDSGAHHYHHRSKHQHQHQPRGLMLENVDLLIPTTNKTTSTVVHPTFLPTTFLPTARITTTTTTTTEKGTKIDAGVFPNNRIEKAAGTTELVEQIVSPTPILLQTTYEIDNLDSHPQKRKQKKRKRCVTEGSLDLLSSTCTSASTSTRNPTPVVLDSFTVAGTLLLNMKNNISTTGKITHAHQIRPMTDIGAKSDIVGSGFDTDTNANTDTNAHVRINVKIAAAKSQSVKFTTSAVVVSSETSSAITDSTQCEEEQLPLLFSAVLYEPEDEDVLTEYQCEIRKHLEIFEATADDVLVSSSPGRCGQIVVGQIGIRCRYCAAKSGPLDTWTKGAVNFSQTIEGICKCYMFLNVPFLLLILVFLRYKINSSFISILHLIYLIH